jgi:hypothetical protein
VPLKKRGYSVSQLGGHPSSMVAARDTHHTSGWLGTAPWRASSPQALQAFEGPTKPAPPYNPKENSRLATRMPHATCQYPISNMPSCQAGAGGSTGVGKTEDRRPRPRRGPSPPSPPRPLVSPDTGPRRPSKAQQSQHRLVIPKRTSRLAYQADGDLAARPWWRFGCAALCCAGKLLTGNIGSLCEQQH